MTSLTDLREVVDVVIGVDTHVHTHSAAVIDSATGGVLGEITVAATAAGYAELVESANNDPMLRAWAIEGTGGHGASLYRLNRYGDRHLNTALHTVVQIRIQYQPATRDYVARRTAQGKTRREIKRCLARATSHATSTASLKVGPPLLDEA
jgi:hypothetical protein